MANTYRVRLEYNRSADDKGAYEVMSITGPSPTVEMRVRGIPYEVRAGDKLDESAAKLLGMRATVTVTRSKLARGRDYCYKG
jgi:hypothetical protein